MTQSYPPAGAQQGPPPNYLVPAILATIFCCLPAGIVSIVFAAQVNSKYAAGDHAGAAESSRKAKTWLYVSVGGALVVAVIYIIIMMVGGGIAASQAQ